MVPKRAKKKSPGSIEKRISKSIIWVGIVPMLLVAVVVGVISVTIMHRSALSELEGKASMLAEALEMAIGVRIQVSETIAKAPEAIEALAIRSDAEEAEYTGDREQLQGYLDLLVADREHLGISLADTRGEIIVSAGSPINQDMPGQVLNQRRDQFRRGRGAVADVDFDPLTKKYYCTIMAPVIDPLDGKLLGIVCDDVDVQVLVAFLFLHETRSEDVVSVVFQMGENALAFRPSATDEDVLPSPLAQSLVGRMQSERWGSVVMSAEPKSGRLYMGYSRINVPVAASTLSVGIPGLYLMVERSFQDVFQRLLPILIATVLAGCAMVITFYLKENRRVHADIVTPISLLNEGAQIIGQGDLELKLQIHTGDELEELAGSFNRMALDLKSNIHQLETSEEKYRTLVTSMMEGIYQTDASGKVTFLNDAAAQIFGYERFEDGLGVDVRSLFLEEIDAAQFDSELRSKGYVERFRCWVRRTDGQAICIELSTNVLRAENGEPTATEGIFGDVTKRIRLEHEAKEKANRIAVINEITNAINSSIDIDRVYETIATEVRKLVVFDCASVTVRGEDGRFERSLLWPRRNGGHNGTPSQKIRGESGLLWVLEHGKPLIIEDVREDDAFSGPIDMWDGEMLSCVFVPLSSREHTIGSFEMGSKTPQAFSRHDVEILEQIASQVGVAVENARLFQNLEQSFEEVKRARTKLAQVNEELKTLDQMKTNLLSNVSHELRTPLVSVMGYTDMILNEKVGAINNTQREYMSISLRNIDRLVTLIDNLLDFSRLYRGTETVLFERFDLLEATRASVQLIRPAADKRSITVELKSSEDDVEVEGDKAKIGQVFDNLLSNAVKFNHNGGTITVQVRKDGAGNAEVAVSDTGIGIPDEALGKVFNRFYQYDSSSTRKYGGTGIGLSIVQDIVRLHGGRIFVTSKEGEGTTFTFSIPLARSATEQQPGVKQVDWLVQLISSDTSLSTAVKSYLADAGFNVVQPRSPQESVLFARRHMPDCIIVDGEVIVGEGEDLIRALKEESASSEIPIVLISDDGLSASMRDVVALRIGRTLRKNLLANAVRDAITGNVRPPAVLGRKVLVVDDDPEIVDFVCRVLEPEGYEVVRALGGNEALGFVRQDDIGLVLLDIAMPEVDGWEVCRTIKGDPELRGVCVLFMTAKAIPGVESASEDTRADGLIVKPFRADELLGRVREVLPAGGERTPETSTQVERPFITA